MFSILHTESSKGWGGQENRILLDRSRLQKLAERAKQSVTENYSIERTVDKTLDLYSGLLRTR